MKRTKIDYGIDLGTTNSAISRMENGEPVIKKSDTLKDTMPSCVYVNKKKAIQVGDSAYNALKRDKLKSMKTFVDFNSNSFIEFKRTMGTDKKYHSSNLGKDLSSEQLSSEVLKTLKSFIKDENVSSVVITVPAAFKSNQIDATKRAAVLAGFHHAEVLQEPVAASLAYGLNSNKQDGFWLVFDFGGGTFDAAILKVEEGIMKTIDTEGDNFLGGKDLDFAIIDEIIIPYLKDNFVIDSLMGDDVKKQVLRNAMKFYAEEAKIKLSFNDTHNILSDLGDIPGEDDEGEEFELDINVGQEDMRRAIGPVFQKAIDITKELLERNNLKGNSLGSLILVGGPTFSPVLREMLSQQICKPDTSVDPMTVVSKGAALYASTVDVSEEVKEQTRDRSKIQLELDYESSSVEKEEYVTLKILEDKTEGEIPEQVFAEISRSGDGVQWASGKVEINTTGEIIDVQLNEGKANLFEVTLYDGKGNLLESEPKQFTIIQGIGGIGTMQTLPYNLGIEIKEKVTGKIVFAQIPGLERNKSLPVIGTRNGLKTQKKIRPGMDSDVIKIPLYQGEHESNGTRAIYNEHVYDIMISGADLPALLPGNSDIDLTVNVDKSQGVLVKAFFPYLDHTIEVEVPTDTVQSAELGRLENEIRKAKGSIAELRMNGDDSAKIAKAEKDILDQENVLKNNPNDTETQLQVLSNLRKSLKVVDSLDQETEWPRLEETLKEEYYRLEKANNELGNEKTSQIVGAVRGQLEEVLKTKDVKLGNALLEDIRTLFFQMTLIYQLIGFIQEYDKSFNALPWANANKARTLLNQGLQIISVNPVVDELHPIVISLINLLPVEARPSGDDAVLVG
jgi:molecular chaperone DnaK